MIYAIFIVEQIQRTNLLRHDMPRNRNDMPRNRLRPSKCLIDTRFMRQNENDYNKIKIIIVII